MTGRKPNLTGIQCFGATAYVKLKNAGKRASKGRFVGYDNESKGYQIFWPEKHAVSIERNVVFNPGDSFEESVEIINEEEQSKVLQNLTEKTSEIPVENPSNQNLNENQNKNLLPEDPAPLNIPTALEHSIEDSTPIVEPLHRSRLCNKLPEPEPNTGCGFQARKAPGAYQRLNQGLDANTVFIDDLEDDLNEPGGLISEIWPKMNILTYLTVGPWLDPWMKNPPLFRRLLRDLMVKNGKRDLKKR